MRGLLIGRFQPFHRGHLSVLHEIAKLHPGDELLIGVGSAQASYTWENPFTAGERVEMIERALVEAKVSHADIFPIADIDRHAVWVAHVASLLPKFERVYTNNPLTRLLFEKAHYMVDSPTLIDRERLEGAQIRRLLAEDSGWADRVPPAVGEYLREIRAPERLRLLSHSPDPMTPTSV